MQSTRDRRRLRTLAKRPAPLVRSPGRRPGSSRPAESPLCQAAVDLDSNDVQHDLARLVLRLVEVIRQLVERQALRRVEGGALTPEQIEKLGLTLMGLEGRMEELKEHFGVTGEELRLNLGGLVEEI